jgi:hypothetical protein
MSPKPDISEFAKRLAERGREHQKERDQAAELYGERTFKLLPFEMQTLSRWRTEHSKTCRLMWNEDGTPIVFPGGANGGLITYHFTDTNLGQVQKASCVTNGKRRKHSRRSSKG